MILDSELERAKEEIERTAASFNESLESVPQDNLLNAYAPVDGMIRIVKENLDLKAPITASSSYKHKIKKEYFTNEVIKIIRNNDTYTFGSIPIILPDGEVANLQIAKSIEKTAENLMILRLVLIAVTLVAMVPVIISSRLLGNLIISPITSMIKTMAEIRQSGKFKRLSLKGKSGDELHEMGETFNHMIDLLEANFEKQKQFASNASHELKTPLTVIESYASLLKRRGKREPEIFAESIEAIHSEAIRMKDMTEQLLLLARHNEQWNIEWSNVDVTEFTQASARAFQNAYNRNIVVKSDSNPVIKTDEQKLKQLLFIFLDNARKYSEDDITVLIGEKDNVPFIRMTDSGIGISRDDLPKVFDRFYRVDKARSRKTGGVGLGLSLAKEIADAIDVDVELESIEGVGTTATLFFR
ncbi:sensor histidine kinase [Cytobacillus purgationiresistens]|uniref:histidine kinase n=1 Tax=Cytobacillus purgationiresistens TaxID=863449 RepID=A0ABU0AHY4_9BACI|nr:HAMP domain-containing sensor histidine kinase [Cytobacillus purgationiresistens]MDQ0270852.1 signal transduction histidine kinase [Cytobacillus purgationiresistens]